MQLATWLGHVVKSGEVTLSTSGGKALQIRAEGNKIELSISDKEFLKDILGSVGSSSSVTSQLDQVKSIAAELKEEGLTITIFYRGDRLATLGSEAKPKFSRLVTRSEAVEINNLRKLMELGVVTRTRAH